MARVGGASDQPGPPGEIPPAFVHVAAPGGFMVRPPGAGPPQLRPGMPPPGKYTISSIYRSMIIILHKSVCIQYYISSMNILVSNC